MVLQLIMAVTILLLSPEIAVAYHAPTHQEINEKISKGLYSVNLSLNSILEQQLGFDKGIDESFRGKRVFDWIRLGGAEEDSPLSRAFNHYHDPLEPEWSMAGFNLFSIA